MAESDKSGMKVRLGVLGAGNVGAAFVRAVHERQAAWAAKGLGQVEVARVLVRDTQRQRDLPLPASKLTINPEDIVGHPEIDVVVSLIGGLSPSGKHIRQALQAGQHVITANKALIAAQGAELERIAIQHDRALLYEAAVGGGMPVIRLLQTHFIPNGVTQLQAILNGTCNFILSEMAAGRPYDAAVKRAQELGFAEADPTLDVSGRDAAQKLAILATLCFGQWHSDENVYCCGVQALDAVDLEFAKRAEMALILLCSAASRRSGGYSLAVRPAFVPANLALARATGPNNVLNVETAGGGPFEGMALGAGGHPTACSVVADLHAILTGGWKAEGRGSLAEAKPLDSKGLPYLAEHHAFYVRPASACEAGSIHEAAVARGIPAGCPRPEVVELGDVTRTQVDELLDHLKLNAAVVQYHPSLKPQSPEACKLR